MSSWRREDDADRRGPRRGPEPLTRTRPALRRPALPDWALVAAALAGLAACDRPAPVEEADAVVPAATSAQVAVDPALHAATLQARSADGPLLSLSCARGGTVELAVDTARPLDAGAPGVAVAATLAIDRAPPRPVSLAWASEPPGAMRIRDAAEVRALAPEIAGAGTVVLRLEQPVADAPALAWQVFLAPSQRRALTRACRLPQTKPQPRPKPKPKPKPNR